MTERREGSTEGKTQRSTEGRTEGSAENRVDTAEFLSQVALFKSLERKVLEGLASRMRMVYLLEGHIIQDNDPVDGLYIIESGWAKVTKASESGETEAVLAILQPGSCFGEIGLIDGLPRTATVTAMEPTWCYFLPRDAFLAALEENPQIAVGMLPALASMVRNADQWIAELL